MDINIAGMTAEDYDAVLSLWQSLDGIGLSDSDSREHITQFLDRNPGLSLIARDNGRVVGAVLCGHDGRRGAIYHLAVAPDFRKRGIGRTLVELCLANLKSLGIQKCNIQVFCDNAEGEGFWKQIGWHKRDDLSLLQKFTDP